MTQSIAHQFQRKESIILMLTRCTGKNRRSRDVSLSLLQQSLPALDSVPISNDMTIRMATSEILEEDSWHRFTEF
jgi:hypothetical protein